MEKIKTLIVFETQEHLSIFLNAMKFPEMGEFISPTIQKFGNDFHCSVRDIPNNNASFVIIVTNNKKLWPQVRSGWFLVDNLKDLETTLLIDIPISGKIKINSGIFLVQEKEIQQQITVPRVQMIENEEVPIVFEKLKVHVCVSCNEEPANTLFTCGHQSFCIECAQKWNKSSCPICRAKTTKIIILDEKKK